MQCSKTEGGSAAVIRDALRRVAAARRRLKKGKASSSLQVLARAKRDAKDIQACADYQRRKGAGTLELIPWEDARKRLGL